MFVIFDRITGEPLVVSTCSDDRKTVIAERAIILLSSHEAGVSALRKIFGKDDDWNLSRFDVRESQGSEFEAFCQLRRSSGVDQFCDETGKLLSEKEIRPLIGIRDDG